MGYIKLKRYENYLLWNSTDDASMGTLGHFLTDEVGMCRAWYHIDLLLDPNFESKGSSYVFMEKDGDQVLIGCLFDEDPYAHALTVPIPVMIDLLKQWDKACKTNPDEVTVYYDNERFTVEGRKNTN